jgi:hypothetical protein
MQRDTSVAVPKILFETLFWIINPGNLEVYKKCHRNEYYNYLKYWIRKFQENLERLKSIRAHYLPAHAYWVNWFSENMNTRNTGMENANNMLV